MRYVIIGNSASGTAAVEAIRQLDRLGNVTVISDEKMQSYSRPLISYFLARKVGLDRISHRREDFYSSNNVELLCGKRALRLDIQGKQVEVESGQKVPYEKLLIATGGTPIVPNIGASGLDGVFTFTNMSDAKRIASYIEKNRVEQALVVGAGLIGLKASEALIELGVRVTIVELADRILSATFDKTASDIVQDKMEEMGCRVLTGKSVQSLARSGSNNKIRATLQDATELGTDLAIVAVGVRPNVELVKGTPVKSDLGILVDRYMRTSVDGIYAAGDCAQPRDPLLDSDRPIAIWPVAVAQGRIAGFNMAGGNKEYGGGFPMNSVEIAGMPSISIGETSASGEDCESLVYLSPDRRVYKKVVLRSGRIVGAIFLGDIERAGIYAGLIRDKIDATKFKQNLLSADFGLVYLPKEYRKHLVNDGAIAV